MFKLNLYLNTLRYLKPGQIFWRVWYRVVRSRVDSSPRPSLRLASGRWAPGARRRQSFDRSGEFTFLNKVGCLAELGWDGPQRDKLWRYNQHYFDDLNSENSEMRTELHRALIDSWIADNIPGSTIGWESYPTSLRIVNWIKWCLAGQSLGEDVLQSLAVQTRWLSLRLERHILGNHLFANAKALVFAGLFFEGCEAEKWLRIGLDIISEELPEQVLSDGGNFERSPMYHAIFLEDLLDLINLAAAYHGVLTPEQTGEWRATAAKMLRWLDGMCHPDGEISFFNDAAVGVASRPGELRRYSTSLGVPMVETDNLSTSSNDFYIRHFAESGYIRVDAMDVCLLVDVAPVGPDYLPGHAHADTLSFELSLFDERVLVNSGTSQYTTGPVRLEERGSAAHNTVIVDNHNSSEVWSEFRVARRAYPRNLCILQDHEGVSIACEHDGFTRLPGRPVHKRSWHLIDGKLIVRDRIEGRFESASARFHFHPNLCVRSLGRHSYSIRRGNSGRDVQVVVLNGSPDIEPSFFAPEFGVRLNTKCLTVHFQATTEVALEISWRSSE